MKGSVVAVRVVLAVTMVELVGDKVEEPMACSVGGFLVISPSKICPALSSRQLSAVELGLVTFGFEEALTCDSRN